MPLSVVQLSALPGPLSVVQLSALPGPLSVLRLSWFLGQKCHVFAQQIHYTPCGMGMSSSCQKHGQVECPMTCPSPPHSQTKLKLEFKAWDTYAHFLSALSLVHHRVLWL